MKLDMFNPTTPLFKGRREDRNTVDQLRQDNNYSLTENNKIRIDKAISNLANEPGETNVKFLIDVADGLTYGTNIELGKQPEHNWKEKLHNATKHAISISDIDTKKKYTPILKRVFNTKKELTNDEKDILQTRQNILSQLDFSQLKNEKNNNIKNVESNLDYFITSSSTTMKQKKYVLNRLNYFLSPDYKINPQLENKKTKVFAEIINDLVVDTPESKVPNTKAINQKSHGMCAAISIARKLMSYEDKPNYVDNILSELDNTPVVMVYDKIRLGEGKKVPVDKIDVDFDDAEKKGYRIVDASTTQWMNIADMYDADSTSKYTYIPFDRENFGAMQDEHFLNPIPEKGLDSKHRYLQALLVSKETIGNAKKAKLEKKQETDDIKSNVEKDLKYIAKINNSIMNDLKQIIPDIKDNEAHETLNKLNKLEIDTSNDNKKLDKKLQEYSFIPNEEKVVKNKKIVKFISDTFEGRVNNDQLNLKSNDLTSKLETIYSTNKFIKPKSTISTNVAYKRKLYNAAAAYRNHVQFSLEDNDYKSDKMIKYNIPDKESLLMHNLDSTIKYINKTGDKRYINHFADCLNVDKNREDVTSILGEVKDSANYLLTTSLDDCYKKIGMGDRKQALLSYVTSSKLLISEGDKDALNNAAFSLDMEPDKQKILKAYTKFEKILANGATDKQYTEIFNKMGFKDQLQAYADAFDVIVNAVNEPNDETNQAIIADFVNANNLPEDVSLDDVKKQLMQVGSKFNNLSTNISFVRGIMCVTDENNKIINTPLASHYIMKKMESNGEVIPAEKLIPLRDRFDAIDKLRSQDEFSSRQGKISDPDLYKFTSGEKETLKQIDKSINQMYSDVNKETAFVLREIKQPLEEHARRMGLSTGNYWVFNKSGGLHTEQEVKILQQMTDKKYEATENFDKAIEKIKNTPYSGITGSSVFHDKIGGHAQYVAEISPNHDNGKDVLYYDNSWGASENENTWIDSEGLRRTDYSDNRGGELGYITNDKYRNGNYIDNLKNKAGKTTINNVENKQLKKLIGNETEQKFPLLFDFIVQGTGDKSKDVAAGIHDSIFVSKNINSLNNFVTKMSKDEINAAITRHETADKFFNIRMNKIDEAINESPFNKGVTLESDYNDLPDDIKLVFEKTALSESFEDGVNWKKLAKAKNMKDIKKLKSERDNKAREYFDYAFGKDSNVFRYYLQTQSATRILNNVKETFNKYNIDFDNKNIETNFVAGTKNFLIDKTYDGSLSNGINKFSDSIVKSVTKDMQNSDKLNNAVSEIKDFIVKDMSDNLYINESDVNNTSTKFKAISKYIDNKYNPQTNEDFVAIYRNLQNMTNSEFQKETSDVKPKDLGIKEYSGYEILRYYKAKSMDMDTNVRNIVYQQELLENIDLSNTKPDYKYNKLYKYHQADLYINGKNFDDNYREFSNILSRMNYPKMFNKYKDDGIKNYGALPAYPYIQPIDNEALDKKYDAIDELFYENFNNINNAKNTIKEYHLTDKLANIIELLPDDQRVSQTQRKKINNLAGQFVTMTFSDLSVEKSLNSAYKILSFDKNATGNEYKSAIADMNTEFVALKKMNPENDLKDLVKDSVSSLDSNMNALIKFEIQDKYQNNLKEDLNNWLREELRPKSSSGVISKGIDKLNSQIDQYSIPKKNMNYTKFVYVDELELNINKLINIKDAIQQTTSEQSKEKLINKFNKLQSNIYKSSNKFIDGNIEPQYRETVKQSIETLVHKAINGKNTLYSQEKADAARSKFMEDYKKYNVLNDASGLLKDYMLLQAKDSELNSKDEKVANLAKLELESKTNTLSSLVTCSELAILQEYIMDAVASGSTGSINERFKNYESTLMDVKTGLPLPFDDEKSIDYMVKSMIIGQNDETAVMFIDKLGLANKFLKAQNELLDFEQAKKDVRKIANILNTTYAQSNIVKDELTQLSNSDIDDSDEYAARIDTLKKNIIDRTSKLNRKKAIGKCLKALDSAKSVIDANPEVSKKAIISQILNTALASVADDANDDIADVQNRLNAISTIYNLVNKLSMPEYSDAYKEREKFVEKFKQFEEYNNSILKKVVDANNSQLNVVAENK